MNYRLGRHRKHHPWLILNSCRKVFTGGSKEGREQSCTFTYVFSITAVKTYFPPPDPDLPIPNPVLSPPILQSVWPIKSRHEEQETHTPHYLHTTFRKLHPRKPAVTLETSCVYIVVVYVFLMMGKVILVTSDVSQVAALSRNSMMQRVKYFYICKQQRQCNSWL